MTPGFAGGHLIAAQREGWLIEAYVRDARGERGACRDLLTQALETRTPFLWSLLLIPNDLLPAVCAIALDQNIARGNVRQLIERFELQAPSPEAQTWPWPVKVYTLGRMYVEKDGEPLRFGHKAQRKPLDLLKALIAFGGRQIDIERLAESIWPDLDGDAAMKVFQITLYRLRKLLGRDDALELHESKLTLNDRCCWVDAWTFERLVDTIDADAEGSREKATQALATRLTQLYAGHFLEKEGDPVWAIAMRDRLRSKYLRCVVMLGIALERAAHWEQAANLYRRALERDNLAEEIYRHLMLCYQQLGLHAQALETYRRCRDMLSLLLGARPCGETEALHARIRQVA